MSRRLLSAVAAGLASIALFASLFAGMPGALLLAYGAPLPLFYVGVTRGPQAVTLAAALGVLATLLLGSGLMAVTYAVVVGVPAVALTRLFLMPVLTPAGNGQWRPAGTLAVSLALLVSVVFVLWAFSVGGDVQTAVHGFLDKGVMAMAPTLPAADRHTLVRMQAPLFPALTLTSWMVMVVLNGVLAQRLAVVRGTALRPSPPWRQITVPRWYEWPLAVMAGGALVAPAGTVAYVAANLTVALLMPYFFQGLAVVHTMADRWPRPRVLLVTFYVTLFLFAGPAALAVAGLGCVEIWARLRHRAVGVNGPQGDD